MFTMNSGLITNLNKIKTLPVTKLCELYYYSSISQKLSGRLNLLLAPLLRKGRS